MRLLVSLAFSSLPERLLNDVDCVGYVQEKLDAAGYKTWIQIFVVRPPLILFHVTSLGGHRGDAGSGPLPL